MGKTLTIFLAGIIITTLLFLCKIQFVKIVGYIITAIIIAATTPLITRKIANIQDAGSTIGGGQHGRIEIFTKEKLIFNGNQELSYEKLPNPSGPIIRVYEKINDTTYEEIQGVNPELDNNKKIIYPIIKATKTIDGKEVGEEVASFGADFITTNLME